MIVVDEYLAIRSILGDLPNAAPDDFLRIPVTANWRSLQRLHAPGEGVARLAYASRVANVRFVDLDDVA